MTAVRPLLIALGVAALTGCAAQALLEKPIAPMSNAALLHHYYTLQRETRNNDSLARTIGDTRTRSNNEAIGVAIAAGFVSGQSEEMRRRTIDARVELERRGWSPLAGLPPDAPVAYVSRPQGVTAAPPMRGGVPSQDYPASQSQHPTGFIPQPPPPQERIAGAGTSAQSLAGESKYMHNAERLTKANGCNMPAASMTAKAPGAEVFSVACSDGQIIVVRCDYNDCRLLTGIPP